jgi:hypothetical protein
MAALVAQYERLYYEYLAHLLNAEIRGTDRWEGCALSGFSFPIPWRSGISFLVERTGDVKSGVYEKG